MVLTTSLGASWRASGVLLAFALILLIPFDIYYGFFKRDGILANYGIFIILGILSIIDRSILHSKGQWKAVIEKYDAWPAKKNFRGTLIVWGAIFLVIANFLLAIHLNDQVR